MGSLLIVACATALNGLDDFELSEYRQETISFIAGDQELVGTLILPQANESMPIAIFVHGDGAQDRFSSSSYLPLMSALLDSGIGIYSWDKAGVGESSGNWLHQSMTDRANEVLAAHAAIRQATTSTGNSIGFIGFSQAGWVLPKVANKLTQDTFFVLFGGATNWQKQAAYFASVRLRNEGYSENEIHTQLQHQATLNKTIFDKPVSYERYLDLTNEIDPMNVDRYYFVANNYKSDSTEELSGVVHPILVLLGNEDLNVEVQREAHIFENTLANGNPDSDVVLWPGATHGLAKARWFNYQLPSQIPWYANLYALFAGRHLYAPGVLEYLANWINGVQK